MRPAAIVLAAALLLAGPTAAPAAEPAPADQLARLLMPKATWSKGMDQLAQMIQSQMRPHPGGQLEPSPELAQKTRKEVEQVLPYDELVGLQAKELAAVYSTEELNGLIAFYKGPLGQKSLEKMPEVSEKVAVATQQRVEAKMPDVMRRLSEEGKKEQGPPSGTGAPPATGGGAAKATK